MSERNPDFVRGVLNLLRNCAGAKPGESLVIIAEDPREGYYGEGLAAAIGAVAKTFDLAVEYYPISFSPDAETLPPELEALVSSRDHALFLARLGDQLRFKAMPAGARPIVSYALDQQAFASGFGTAPYPAFVALKSAINTSLGTAGHIRVTCPLGTDFSGSPSPLETEPMPDVSIKRFPMSVFAPMPAASFAGRVAVAHMICGTGSRYYEPFGYRLEEPLFVMIENGRVIRWDGAPSEVRRVETHYDVVSSRYGIDAGFIHSWHAGIHPGCAYTASAHESYERWGGSAFGNPRLLHFHTCGAYAPGEICWNIVDPTIEADGQVIWDHGRLCIDAIPGAAAILGEYPEVASLFASPDRRIGLGV